MKCKGQGSPAHWDQAVDQHNECWSKVGLHRVTDEALFHRVTDEALLVETT